MGRTESFGQLFRITTTSDTIDWKAMVDAPHDVNESNNTVTATSSVRGTGGGKGGYNSNGNTPGRNAPGSAETIKLQGGGRPPPAFFAV